ncbi:tRNA(adenine34) deaminase [Desulfobotulus alkaliphilus]|uniref:tRNA(Adenine34) deaminase n=1 Tax=Desulfobotulus alkaliphilus TaxID=622671 RepID=A0A562RAG7_9BACT|nr:nucleoside deaminase [Desulfobotulus alkaliphilus]TWI66035.1 tRNA(adenine34) deaminase [Desulfobotulus alkaliphilus]
MNKDHEFMGEALILAENALKEGEFPVGCVITLNGSIRVKSRRKASNGSLPSEITHAEILAIRELESLVPAAMRHKATLYATMEPCLMCYAAILLSGIGRVVWAYEDAMGGGTACDLSTLPPLYGERQPDIRPALRREESLALFMKFFRNPKNAYWKNSLLARYTLAGGRSLPEAVRPQIRGQGI